MAKERVLTHFCHIHTATSAYITTSSSAVADRPRCRVGYFLPKVEDWNWETIFCGHCLHSSTTVT